ncbi:MAG: iron-containing alcohol dehydrogenase family protein [Isosphaeraceae bacterium]
MDPGTLRLRALQCVFAPPEVCAGRGALDRLCFLGEGPRVLVLVTGVSTTAAWRAPLLAKIQRASACEVVVWPGGEPTGAAVAGLRDRVVAFAPNWIVGVGGGSVLDAAKFVWAQYEHPEVDWSVAGARDVGPGHKARLALVPTTAGSGSEASQTAILIAPGGEKVAYLSTHWVPGLVVLDPSITATLPAAVTVSTGFDALAHAVESAVSVLSHSLLRGLSAAAIRGVLHHLPRSVRAPQDLASREGMQAAAYLGGLCQSTASTGAAHALAHAAGRLFRTPHSVGTTLFLPPTMAWNHQKNPKPYDELATSCGMARGEALLGAVSDLADEVGAPRGFADILGRGLTAREVGALVEAAAVDVCLRTNPCRLTRQDLEALVMGVG